MKETAGKHLWVQLTKSAVQNFTSKSLLKTQHLFPQQNRHLKTSEGTNPRERERACSSTQSWCGHTTEGARVVAISPQTYLSHLENAEHRVTKTLPASGRLVSRMMGDVRVIVHEGLGSFSAVTMIAASSTQRFTSYLSSVTVCNNRYSAYERDFQIIWRPVKYHVANS